jgi:hypothetical protein
LPAAYFGEEAERLLKGKKGLVIGITNEKSIAFDCASAFAAPAPRRTCTGASPIARRQDSQRRFAVLTTRLLHSMKRDGGGRGVVTLCLGSGQGVALTLQALH